MDQSGTSFSGMVVVHLNGLMGSVQLLSGCLVSRVFQLGRLLV